MRTLEIHPLDVWLFRDGRPFDADSGHRATSMFPPLPTVVQGMLRSAYLAQLGAAGDLHVSSAIGTAYDFGSLRMRGPFLKTPRGLVYALPADTFRLSNVPDNRQFDLLRLRPVSALHANRERLGGPHQPTHVLLPPEGAEPAKVTESLVEATEFATYAKAKVFEARANDGMWRKEDRYGNGIDNARQTTLDGRLFQVQYVRPAPELTLHIELVDGLWVTSGLEPPRITSFGGERRQAAIATSTTTASTLPSKSLDTASVFKIVFLTPTYFAGGWQPEHGRWAKFFDSGQGTVEFLGAALHKHQSAGGFDVATQSHKANLRYVPAGSAYFFRLSRTGPIKAINDWICDEIDPALLGTARQARNPVALGHIGFGQFAMIDAGSQVA